MSIFLLSYRTAPFLSESMRAGGTDHLPNLKIKSQPAYPGIVVPYLSLSRVLIRGSLVNVRGAVPLPLG